MVYSFLPYCILVYNLKYQSCDSYVIKVDNKMTDMGMVNSFCFCFNSNFIYFTRIMKPVHTTYINHACWHRCLYLCSLVWEETRVTLHGDHMTMSHATPGVIPGLQW